MAGLRSIIARIVGVFRRQELDERIDEELQFHIEMQTEDNIRRGMSPQEARRQALLSSGGVEQVKEEHRDVRAFPFLTSLARDLSLAVRSLRRNVGFTTTVLVTLVLGIAAVTSVFTVANAVFFDAFPYRDYDRVAGVAIAPVETDQGRQMFTIPEYLAIREKSRTLEDAFAHTQWFTGIAGDGGREMVRSPAFSDNAFEFLGVKPLLGRTFLPDDYSSGGSPRPVAVLSYDLWQGQFGADPAVLGREVHLEGIDVPHTVVGVMPRRFTLFNLAGWGSVWRPLQIDETPQHPVMVFVRLKRGVSLEAASADLQSILAGFAEADPKSFPPGGFAVRLTPLSDSIGPGIRTTAYLLLASVGFLLLIACFNVANLLLARGCARSKEVSVRLSVGAKRWHLVRQLLTESLLLSLSGGFLGVLLAFWGTKALAALIPPNAINSEMDFRVNSVVLASAFAVSVLTGILFGLIPALHSTRVDLSQTLKDAERGSSGGSSGRWTRSALVVSAVAFSMVLLVGAGLMIRTFVSLTRDDHLGVRSDQVLIMWMPAGTGPTPELRNTTNRSILEQLQSAPEVESAAFTAFAFLRFPPLSGWNTDVEIEGHTSAQELEASFHPVSADYFETLGIPLLEGSLFSDRDVFGGQQVAVINQTMVRSFFPDGEDPIGRNVRLAMLEEQDFEVDPWVRIVGVVADSRNEGPREEAAPEIFVPFTLTLPDGSLGLAIRTRSDPSAALPKIRSRITTAVPGGGIQLREIRTLKNEIAIATAQERFTTVLLCVFAALGIALAAIGIYGVVSYSVAQRTHEFGIRMALGADRGDVLRKVLGNGLLLSVIGVMIGLAAALGLTRLIESQLYDVTPSDPATFLAGSLILIGVTLLASYVPARRATRVDPMVALRYE